MADVSRRMKRLVEALERQGARVRSGHGGWVVYPPNPKAKLITLHTSPKSSTGAFHTLRREVERAGLSWPDTL